MYKTRIASILTTTTSTTTTGTIAVAAVPGRTTSLLTYLPTYLPIYDGCYSPLNYRLYMYSVITIAAAAGRGFCKWPEFNRALGTLTLCLLCFFLSFVLIFDFLEPLPYFGTQEGPLHYNACLFCCCLLLLLLLLQSASLQSKKNGGKERKKE